MSNFGRNFELLQSPHMQHRLGRYVNGSTQIPIGAPVKVDTAIEENGQGRLTLKLATGATTKRAGFSGIAVYEWAFNAYRGDDQALTVISDKDYVPAGAPVQLVHGDEVKVRFTNTEDRLFQFQRNYEGRIMVAGLGATPTLAEGDLLRPGVGNDDTGYWTETSTEADAWFYVTSVHADLGYVDAQMLF